jgi:ADP-heptose:LPS heptosyltransferase
VSILEGPMTAGASDNIPDVLPLAAKRLLAGLKLVHSFFLPTRTWLISRAGEMYSLFYSADHSKGSASLIPSQRRATHRLEPHTSMRIGILTTDGIGDVICASGLVADIRQAWPDAEICMIVRLHEMASLFGGPSRIDDVIVYDPARGNSPARVLKLVREIRRRRFDVFVAVTDIDRHKAPCLSFVSGAPVRVGEAASPLARLYTGSVRRDSTEHKVTSNGRIAALLGIDAFSPPRVSIDPDDALAVDRALADAGVRPGDRLLAVHPGSGLAESHKRWGIDDYEAMIRHVSSLEVRPILVGAGGDIALCDILSTRLGSSVLSFAGKLSLSRSAALLARCALAVGADSGVMHLAAAVGTPTICVFGPTDERRTAPFGATRIVSANVPCRPCYSRLPHGCGNPICMSRITVAQVVAEVNSLLFAAVA